MEVGNHGCMGTWGAEGLAGEKGRKVGETPPSAIAYQVLCQKHCIPLWL